MNNEGCVRVGMKILVGTFESTCAPYATLTASSSRTLGTNEITLPEILWRYYTQTPTEKQ